MTSRKRNSATTSSSSKRRDRQTSRPASAKDASLHSRMKRRQSLLETLEPRQLLAGPQLIGIQPNEGDLIVNGSELSTAPRVLTFGFDQGQQIDSGTLDGIRVTRSGDDGVFNTGDDVQITPGLVTLGEPNENEVVVRFAESLPDDNYRIEVFGFDDPGRNIVALRNTDGEALIPDVAGSRSDVIDFQLKLGALIEAVVPQPVVRTDDGSLHQNRDEIVVYFNEDPLFVENDESGNPTERSAENPRFYQLLLTQETVRTTDDLLFQPDRVVYDQATHTARLFFAGDINNLPGVSEGGGTWRLRIGTAVDSRVDLILPPTQVAVTASAVNDFQYDGLRVTFFSKAIGEAGSGREISFIDSGSGGLIASLDVDGHVIFDFGGDTPTFNNLQSAITAAPAVVAAIGMNVERNGVAGDGANLTVPSYVVGAPAMQLHAAGETLSTALDVGVFGPDNQLTSLVFSESIEPQPFGIDLPGSNNDPGHRTFEGVNVNTLVKHINSRFGADSTDGITEIPYNFNGIFESVGNNNFLNQIDERQKDRIREAVNLWASQIGVQFRETVDQGITFAVGDTDVIQSAPGTQRFNTTDYTVRIDPTFDESLLVFGINTDFDTAFGESFFRVAMSGIGFLLGLEQAGDLPPQTLMSLNRQFLFDSINTEEQISPLEPIFPGNFDVLHGQHLHRPDSIDVDLYRFEVDLGDANRQGLLTAETFAERLADSSLLDTTLTLFEEVQAVGTSDFGVGIGTSVRFDAIAKGIAGNNARIDFILSNRTGANTGPIVSQAVDASGNGIPNAILIDLPRASVNVTSLTIGDVIDAINNDPFASSIMRASLASGDANEDILRTELDFGSVVLRGGGLNQLSRNDDYFSEDSRITASLDSGVYYIGIAASGNDNYDPSVPGSSFGGLTQGRYDLNLKFEPQVDESDAIRDLDSSRVDVPGTLLDGDGDGVPGGVHNFWFQTRPENRLISFTDNGAAITNGQTLTVTGANGIVRTFQFVDFGGSASGGNIPVFYNSGASGQPTPAGNLAGTLQSAINSVQGITGVTASQTTSGLEFRGEQKLEFSDNFRGVEVFGRNIFVDKTAGPQADGSLASPFNNISNSAVANAFGSSLSGDIVRIVGNGGADQDITTIADNFSYQIGTSNTGGVALEDGRTMEVPAGVTTIIDAGAAFKLRGARIGVGSSTVQVDRSGGALQVLGTPRLIDISLSGETVETTLLGGQDSQGLGYDDGSVIFTSLRDRSVDTSASGNSPAPAAGDWGGIVYRRDLDQAEGRRDLEDEGIFLQYVNHAEFRYGGSSNVVVDSVQQLINPIQMINLRPTITFNEIMFSADAAISASPNSFAEESYQSPLFQQAGSFTADYDRVGPDIHNNLVVNNSINGLFIRSETSPNRPPDQLTVAGRLDDTDIVHYLAENLVVAGQPGGSIDDGFAPNLSFVSGRRLAGGTLQQTTAAGQPNYEYRLTFVDRDGFESRSTEQANAFQFTVSENNSSIELIGLPLIDSSTSDFVSRRLYRAVIRDASGNVIPEQSRSYELVADLDSTTDTYIDNGSSTDGLLDINRLGIRGRLDGSLVFDPGLILKLRGARIELGYGTQLLAEGVAENRVIITSSLDDRFGTGGTFDTNNDNQTANGATDPERGDWSGIYAAAGAHVSLDNAVIAFGGGISLLEGGESRGFAPLELQQATGRITNTRFEFNDDGQDGAGASGRQGRLDVDPSVIFVRGSQPTIVGNEFIDNRGAIITIDSESMTSDPNEDEGRQTGSSERIADLNDNRGPLIRQNVYDVVPADLPEDIQVSGLVVRAGVTVTTESVFDDTDIVHILNDSLTVDNFHSSGGLRLQSRPDESLVIKLSGGGTPNSATLGTGITATGTPSDIVDRIGGSVQIIGYPGAPVVLTSIKDDTVGAGRRPDGSQFTDTNGDSFGSRPAPNDWRSILLDQYSNDRNVDVQLEQEASTSVAPGNNATTDSAQLLGELAPNLSSSDDQRRLGFEVEGYLSGPADVDTYSFIGIPGTEVWIDIDRTSSNLDTVIELLDATGKLLARSDNSFAEIDGTESLAIFDDDLESRVSSLQSRADEYTDFSAGGLYSDFHSLNLRDAGIHLPLPGSVSPNNDGSTYFFRVRSASVDPDDVTGGLTDGSYRVQVRLQEEQEFPGSVIRYADIRFANHGIHIQGLPGSSPLLGEAQENESVVNPTNVVSNFLSNTFTDTFASNDVIVKSVGTATDTTPPGARAQNLGNLTGNKSNVISVGGSLQNFGNNSPFDVDFYQFDISLDDFGATQFPSTVFDIDYAADFNSRPDTRLAVFYDPDGERGDTLPRLIYVGESSNIAEDQPSPGTTNDLIERLARGSVSTNDPFIGPVALAEGSYYVAVTEQGFVPEDFIDNILLRREPINSVNRIVVDRIDETDTDTAGPAQISELFSDASIASGGFEVTLDRGVDRGHGNPRDMTGLSNQTYSEGLGLIPFDVGSLPATSFDLDTLDWSAGDRADIGSSAITGSTNTSIFIPHVSVNGSFAGDIADFFQITIPTDNTRVIIDVDEGFNPFQGIDDDDDATPPFRFDPDSVDLDLVIIDAGFNFVTTPTLLERSDALDGRAGSPPVDTTIPGFENFDGESLDPFFDGFLNAGTYFIGLVPPSTSVTADGTTVGVTSGAPLVSGEYLLHVSVEDHVVPSVGNNESIHFDRPSAIAPGQLVSEAFDLSGYGAADLPNLYFNYLYSPGLGDSVQYTITSDQAAAGSGDELILSDLQFDAQWRQNIVDLSDFAGHTGVQVTFDYNLGAGSGEGLYLDDFVVGFAERGEEVFFAREGEDEFRSDGSTIRGGGEYQLELRRGTDFATSTFGQINLQRSFDTNARHAQEVTLVTPAGDQVVDGDTFQISDGSITQTFEFDVDGEGVTGFDSIPVRIASTATATEVAEVIRDAINQSNRINVEASSSSGNSTGAMTDNRLNLYGAANGTFQAISAPTDAPPAGTMLTASGGHVLIPAMLFDGTGDENYLRTQGQVIIESNTISDVRAIGIWSEPGLRDVDEEDRRQDPEAFFFGNNPFDGSITAQHPFLQQPPVGNPYPGAVRNLPVTNDSVLGGLAPGVVVRNNTIDQAGYAGIKVDGEARPWVITDIDGTVAGSGIADGHTFAIDAAGTRVVFEFDDVSGENVMNGGSGVVGGDGVADGHVPIYYRLGDGDYNDGSSNGAVRPYPYSNMELMTAIHQAIQGSILVTNGLVELVTPYIGPSPFSRDEAGEENAVSRGAFPTAAVYVYGASAIYDSNFYQKIGRTGAPSGFSSLQYSLAPISEAVQPVAQVVNNTIYGADGTEYGNPDAADTEPNDLLSQAVDTKRGRSHNGAYIDTATIGSNIDGVDPSSDVDFYQVELVVGDRLIIDIDTVAGGVDTVVQLFDEVGERIILTDALGNKVTSIESGDAPDHLDPRSTVATPVTDDGRGVDPFVDFTALETGTYYVAVSSSGNTSFDPETLSGRSGGTGGTGDYEIGLEVYAPRSVVMSIDDGAEGAGNTGTKAADLVGTTFTVTQIPDFAPGTPTQSGDTATTVGNQITFEFTNATGGRTILANGNVNVPLITADDDGYRVPGIMRAIQESVRGIIDPNVGLDQPTIPNNEFGNGPDGRTGPVTRATATALGGRSGDNDGIANLSRFNALFHWLSPTDSDFIGGFGHNRKENGEQDVVPGGTLTDGDGTTELYVLWENIAGIELSPEAIAAGLKLTPDSTKPEYSQESDQLLAETGILIAGGSSSTLLNNVIVNTHQGIVSEESSYYGFGQRVVNNSDEFIKPQNVVLAGNVFQNDEPLNNQIRFDLTWPIDIENPFDFFDTGTSTDIEVGATNVADQADDFNFVVGTNEPLLRNPQGNDFTPDQNSIVIDSAINTLVGRDALSAVAQSVGLSVSNIFAPDRDVNGILRADNPLVAPPGGLGSNVFKDRGSNELADFIGPVAALESPRDNDANAIDGDPAVGFLNLKSGVYDEFRIQLSDNGDESDPFIGFGIDDQTVVVSDLPGIRKPGAVITLFENDRLLQEGIDYTFSYDETKNVITLKPLAGIWRNDRSYRIALNNQDRTVLTAPDANSVSDGDQFSITDTNGGKVVFEFESGYTVLVPEALTITVPQTGTNAGGLSDGDIFLINDGSNPPVVFEFNSDAASLPGSVQVPLSADPTPLDAAALETFLNQIAMDIEVAIQGEVTAGRLDLDVRRDGTSLVLGAEPGATVTTSGSGLQQASRTLAMVVPAVGTAVNGVADGDTFTLSNGNIAVTFEVDTNGTVNSSSSVPVTLSGTLTGNEVADIISSVISSSALGLDTSVSGQTVYLNLPANGSASVGAGSRLTVSGLARTPGDGDTITFNPTGGGAAVVFEVNRTDEPDGSGGVMDDGVTDPNIPINLTRSTTADEFAGLVATAIQGQSISGLNANEIQPIDGGTLAIGGDVGLGLSVTGNSFDVIGAPSVTGSSTLQVFGPLILSLPQFGGGGVLDGTTIILRDAAGNRRIFEFEELLTNNGLDNPAATSIPFNSFDDVDALSTSFVNTINAAGLGITAQHTGMGRISLGRIDASRVEIPVILRLPTIGGAGIPDEATITLNAADGTPQVFEFDSNGTLNDPTAIAINYTVADSVAFIASNVVNAINSAGLGINAERLGNTQVSLGSISTSRVELQNGSVITAVALQGAPLRRAIVNDGEVLTLRQGGFAVNFEFESVNNGGGVNTGNIAVAFQPGSTVGDVAVSLAAAINNNKNGLRLDAVAELDSNGQPTGQVFLNDLPGTIIDVSRAQTLNVTGVPGGAIPVRINPAFSATEVKQALLTAINSVNIPGELPSTTLSASDRGGATLFVSNGQLFEGPITSYFLPGVKDKAGNLLEENRDDLTTQFTILMPTVGLDFGDAPDPVTLVPGRYPTLVNQDGARHVIGGDVRLGSLIDADIDGMPVRAADGDDLTISISSLGTLFETSVVNGSAQISVAAGVDPSTRDGDTITINTGVAQATLEFDLNGRFNEDNFAIRPISPITPESIATAIEAAIIESPIVAAAVVVDGGTVSVVSDDEDGVDFGSDINPAGILNKGVLTPISVTVTGSGVVEAWIDFNVDGDWTDPGEQIIGINTPGAIFTDAGGPVTRVFTVTVPTTSPTPPGPMETYARFRVSRDGGLDPTGLALSGEVEDYRLSILPGSPPTLTDANANRVYTVAEDRPLQVLDRVGTLTPNDNDNGLLVGVVDPDGDDVAIIPQDVGMRTLTTPGGTVAGELNVSSDGTFTFVPALDFNGVATFTARVTDLNSLDPSSQIINSRPISVTINVTPINDRPFATTADVIVNRTIDEDVQQTFTTADLIDPFYVAGPDNESDQPLIIQSAGSIRGNAFSSQGGSITLANGGTVLIYTPPADYNGTTPDTFTYVVADVVPSGQLSESATQIGTVTLTINAVNDAPRLVDDQYFTEEDVALVIPINGTAGNPGILDDDTAGPADEVSAGQTIMLQDGQFPKTTFRGGNVRIEGSNLVYTPPALFSGSDQFEYTVIDNLGLTATATVSVVVGGVNNAPRFVGIDGDPGQVSLSFTESKLDPVQQTFNLTNWFSDPESDPLTFVVTSSNASIVAAAVQGELLTLTLPPFAFGNATLSVTARDSSGLTTTQQVPVTVVNTPDAPQVIGSLDPLAGTEDMLVTADLSTVFDDPDGEQLQYTVARLGGLITPTPSQIAQHPLVQSIQTVGDQLRIQLKPNQSGTVEIELAASDGSQQVSDTFELQISAVPDAPIAVADGYNVPIGATLQVLNPADGLLRNDGDADGDLIQVDLNSVTNPTLGTVQVNANGTFVYTSQSGDAGEVDTFTYRTIDSTGRQSEIVTVSLTLNQSAYQNPIQGFEMDVNADGKVSAIDALRVINLLNRRLSGQGGDLPVSEIGSPPPDYVDVDGNGRITANDALRVINELNRRNATGQGEQFGEGEFLTPIQTISGQLDFASTTAFASASTSNLPVRNLSPAPVTEADTRDTLFTAGLEIDASDLESTTELLSSSADANSNRADSIDDALSSLLDDLAISTSING